MFLTPNIYMITNNVNGKIYIGKSKFDDPNYFGSGKLINQAIIKHSKSNFTKIILEYCSFDILNNKEIFWINHFDSRKRNIGYNIAKGGMGGDTISAHPRKNEIIKKHRLFLLSNKHPTRGKKMKPWTNEHRMNMSISLWSTYSRRNKKLKIKNENTGWTELKRLKFSLQRSGSLNTYYGKKHSELVRNKISEKLKNIPKSEEHKNKISNTLKSKKLIPENSVKTVIDGIEYNSMYEASIKTNINYSTLRNRIKNPKYPNFYILNGNR